MAKSKEKSKTTTQTFRVSGHHPLIRDIDRKGKRKTRDSLDVQISVTVKVPKGKRLSAALIEEAIKFRANTGRNPKGFKIKMTRWRNPDRVKVSDRDWRGIKHKRGGDETQNQRFLTLGRAIQSERMVYSITRSGSSRRKSRRKKTVSRFRQAKQSKPAARIRRRASIRHKGKRRKTRPNT